MSGQLALQVGAEVIVVPAVVWETLPVDRQVQVTLRLARLLAALVEAVAMSSGQKITERHRQRRAVVYVRQSSPRQLERNVESTARQYALRERAVELGWPTASVVVVDEDTGRSGASTQGRLGFKELVADVGLGNVGLILALEVSRFARSSTDWHQLIDLCALTGTLIADSDGSTRRAISTTGCCWG